MHRSVGVRDLVRLERVLVHRSAGVQDLFRLERVLAGLLAAFVAVRLIRLEGQ